MGRRHGDFPAMVEYKIVYRPKAEIGVALNRTIPLPNVKSLARHLNNFVKMNPSLEVLTVYVVEDGKFVSNVKFLYDEFKNQCWLTGYKERLLANAIKQGYELNWKPCYQRG